MLRYGILLEGTDFDLSFAFVPGDDDARIHTWVAHYLLLLQRCSGGNLLPLLLHRLLHLHKWLLLHLLLLLIVHDRSNILLLLILELLLLWHHRSGLDGRPVIMLMVKAIVLHRPLLLQGKLVKRLLVLLRWPGGDR